MRARARRALRWIEPYGFAERRRTRVRARDEVERQARYHATMAAIARSSDPIHDYEQIVALAIEAGADRERLQGGSIGKDSLGRRLDRAARTYRTESQALSRERMKEPF